MIEARGPSAELRVGYHHAIEIGWWELHGEPPGACEVSGEVLSADPFWSTQRPMSLTLRFQGGLEWTWENVVVSSIGDTATARVYGRPAARRAY